MRRVNPCLGCGACCAHFRVSFYWAEADPAQGGTVPSELAEDVTQFLRCMRGTNQAAPRCAALEGEIGQRVCCAIYKARPLPCREFGVAWTNGVVAFTADGLERCTQARAAWGLPPLPDELGKPRRPRRRSRAGRRPA